MSLELIDISTDGRVPKSVVKDAGAARTIYSQFLQDDLPANIERANIQGIKDRNPPYNPQQLIDLGQAGRTNVSWGLAESSIEAGTTPYYDIVTSVPQVATILTNYGGPIKCEEYGRIVSEEFDKTMRDWDEFLYHLQVHQDQLLTFGIGPMLWRDERDWRFESVWRRDILVPSDAKASRNKLDIVFIKDWMKSHEVYRYIENPARARATGWSVSRGKQAIMDASTTDPDRQLNWEYWQEQFKDNNYYISYARTKTVAIVHCLAREFDGRVSHYIFTRNPLSKDDGFIFSKVGRFEEMNQALWMCFDGVGNSDFKSVRGYGTKIAAWAQADDIFNNTLMDNAILSNTVLIKANTAADVQRFAAVEIGSFRIIPPNFEFTQVQLGGGLRESMNVGNYFRTLNNSYNAAYKSPGMPERTQGNPETATEQQIKAGQRARLSTSKAEKYLNDVDRLWWETYRRMSNPKLVDAQPGAKEALEFQERCIARGVPAAFFKRDGDKLPKHIISVKATRAIGNGSPDGRTLALQTIAPLVYAKSPQQKQDVFTRDFIAAQAGTQYAAERYGPDLNEQAPGIDEWMAQQENNDFITGIDPIISPDQKHYVHAVVHIAFMAGLLGDQQEDPMDPTKLVEVMDAAGMHTAQHIALLKRDPTRRSQVGELEQQMSVLMQQVDALRAEASQVEKDRLDSGGAVGLEQISERLNINYKDAPEDVKRQIEELLGLEPSRMLSVPQQTLQLKQELQGVKTAKTGADIRKDQAQVALSDAKTAEDIRKSRAERLNGGKNGGSDKK